MISHSRDDMYLTREIGARKVLHHAKGTRKRSPSKSRVLISEMDDGRFEFQYDVADGLLERLREWWESLPTELKFAPNFTVDTQGREPRPPAMEDTISMLRADYIGIQLVIDFPLIDYYKTTGDLRNFAKDEPRVKMWIDNNLRFIAAITPMIKYNHPNLWTMSNSYIPAVILI